MFDKNIKSLDDFVTQKELVNRLKKYISYCKKNNTMYNLLFYGLKYSGKKTLVNCLLYNLYGEDINKMEQINYDQKIGNTLINISLRKSKFHYIIDPSKYMNYDKTVLVEFIKQFMSTKNISTNSFNVCIILNVNLLSKSAQNALKRILEKYYNTCRFIFVSNNISQITSELISRFTLLKCRSPNQEDIDNLNKLYGTNINLDRHNIRETLFKFNNVTIDKKTFIYNFPEIVYNTIIKNKYKNIFMIRDHIYTILNYNIDNTNIIKECYLFFYNKLKLVEHKRILLNKATLFQKNMLTSNKQIIHIEGFIITFIYLLEKESKIK
tara:strand:- start:14482 stop:15453 length:972 start_codon:yes stop_codon:yes gene_type:complete